MTMEATQCPDKTTVLVLEGETASVAERNYVRKAYGKIRSDVEYMSKRHATVLANNRRNCKEKAPPPVASLASVVAVAAPDSPAIVGNSLEVTSDTTSNSAGPAFATTVIEAAPDSPVIVGNSLQVTMKGQCFRKSSW